MKFDLKVPETEKRILELRKVPFTFEQNSLEEELDHENHVEVCWCS